MSSTPVDLKYESLRNRSSYETAPSQRIAFKPGVCLLGLLCPVWSMMQIWAKSLHLDSTCVQSIGRGWTHLSLKRDLNRQSFLTDFKIQSKRLLQRRAYTMTSHQEMSIQQVVSYVRLQRPFCPPQITKKATGSISRRTSEVMSVEGQQ